MSGRPPDVVSTPLSSGRFALYLTNVAIGYLDDGGGSGAVILISGDGKVAATVRTTGVMDPKLAFDGHAMVFSDATADYLWSDRLTRSARPREFVTSIATFGLSGGRGVSIFNVGSEHGSEYRSAVTTFGGTSVPSAIDLVGLPMGVGQCGDSVYGLLTPGTSDNWEAVVKLDPGPGFGVPKGRDPAGSRTTFGTILPCRQGKLYALEQSTTAPADADGNPHRQPPRVAIWNVETGEHTTVLMEDHEGRPVADLIDWEGKTTMPDGDLLLLDQDLFWVTTGGRVMATDVESGQTRIVFTVPAQTDGDFIRLCLDHDSLIWSRQSGTAVDLVRYDLRSGVKLDRMQRIELPSGADDAGFVADAVVLQR